MKALQFIFLLLLPLFSIAQSAFDKANELYKSESYQDAIQEYEQILNSGVHSVELYYNLGNAHYKLNQIAPAVYNYEKALLLEPNNADVKNNLKFAQNMMIDDIKEVPKVGFSNWLSGFTSVYHYDVWAKVAVFFSVLILIGFVGYYFSGKIILKRIFFTSMIVFLVFSILSIIIAVFEKNQSEQFNPAIVFSETAHIKGEPNTTTNNILTLHEGSKVFIQEEVQDWYKVELINGTSGWIQKSSVKRLKE